MSSLAQYNCDPNARPDGATVTTGELVAELLSSAAEPQQSVETLLKLVTNVMAHPSEKKFQEVRKANSIVQTSIASVAPCATLLRRCGFQDEGESYYLQRSGLRVGELARITVALSQHQLTQDLSASLQESIRRHLGMEVTIAQAEAAVHVASVVEVARAGRPLARPGWTAFQEYDADCYRDAHSMAATNMEACFQCAEENGFGGICVYEGRAYFRETPGAELQQRLVRTPRAAFYTYEPPFLGAPSGAASSSLAAPPAAAAAAAAEDEEDLDLQEALRLSMRDS